MPEKRVTIIHADGREYSIEPKAFTKEKLSPDGSYAERGFQIVGYVDGSRYDGPKTQTEIEAGRAPAGRSARNVQPAKRPKQPKNA